MRLDSIAETMLCERLRKRAYDRRAVIGRPRCLFNTSDRSRREDLTPRQTPRSLPACTIETTSRKNGNQPVVLEEEARRKLTMGRGGNDAAWTSLSSEAALQSEGRQY